MKRHASFSPSAPLLKCCAWDEAFESEKWLRYRFERSAMDRARAEFMELQKMQFGTVTFMLAEKILRKLRAKVTH
jgi:hypothetical protein